MIDKEGKVVLNWTDHCDIPTRGISVRRDDLLCMCVRLKHHRSVSGRHHTRRRQNREKSTYVKDYHPGPPDTRVGIGHKLQTDTKCHTLFFGIMSRIMLVLRCSWLEQGELVQAEQGSLTININKVSTLINKPSSQPVPSISKPKSSNKEEQGG